MEVIPYFVSCILSSIQETTLEVVSQVLDYSFCVAQFGSPGLGEAIDAVQVTLGALMCFLVLIQFVRQSLQMYKETKRIQLNRYLTLFAKEGIFYFLAILTYSLINMVNYAVTVPSDQGWFILLYAVQFVPAYTVAPRLVLSLRELYAQDTRGRHGGDIDTAFGLASGHGRGQVETMIVFAEGGDGEEGEREEVRMEHLTPCVASSSAGGGV